MTRRDMTIPCTVRLRQCKPRSMERVVFSFDSEDPFVVTLSLSTIDGTMVSRSISRELLALGCGAWVGEGNVKIYPSSGRVRIDICEDRGPVTFDVLKLSVDGFLGLTYQLVPVQADDPSAPLLRCVEQEIDALIAETLKEA